MVDILIDSEGKALTTGGKALISPAASPVITSLNVTPTTSAQTITAPSGTDGYSPVNVAAVTAAIDSDIKASNIKSGVSILGVTGTVTELNGETRTMSLTSSAGNTFTPSSGKNGITSITVTPTNEARTVNPSTSSQSLTVNSGYSGNGTITVNPVTASIDANITAENIKKDVTILGVTGSLESGGGSGKYQLLERVKDDNNVEIGTVSGFFIDGNDIEYAVVCLDAQYRLNSGEWCSNSSTSVTNLPLYSNVPNAIGDNNSGTFNTQKILDFCSSNNYTSAVCSHCRNKNFTINGVIYYGQLPNVSELTSIYTYANKINTLDVTASSYPSLKISSNLKVWSSTQKAAKYAWQIYSGGILENTKTVTSISTCPILEIPV